MPVEVKLPTVLRTHADGQPSVSVDGATVGEVFTALVEQYPGLRGNLLDDAAGCTSSSTSTRTTTTSATSTGSTPKLADGDVLSILPAVAGGA